MGEEELRIVGEIQRALYMEDLVDAIADEEAAAEIEAMLARLAETDFEISMVASQSAGGGTFDDRGIDGWRRLWSDWTEAFETYRIELEKMIDAGDKVVSLVRIVGRTRTGGVEIADTSAAVWTIKEGRLSRVEFHLDPAAAIRAAGLEPRG